jgi:hypothetical protein
MASSIAVLIEEGRKRCFASALDWPGWASAGKTPDAALAALEACRGRYDHVLHICGLGGLDELTGRLIVVETLEGDATTDFGAPSAISDLDRRPLQGAPTSDFFAVILQGCWINLDDVAARTTTPLRKGPRGGGRDVDTMVRHVAEAEVAYGRGLGLTVAATKGDPERVWGAATPSLGRAPRRRDARSRGQVARALRGAATRLARLRPCLRDRGPHDVARRTHRTALARAHSTHERARRSLMRAAISRAACLNADTPVRCLHRLHH